MLVSCDLIYSHSHQVEQVSLSVLQFYRMNLRLREVKPLPRGHTARKQRSQDNVPSLGTIQALGWALGYKDEKGKVPPQRQERLGVLTRKGRHSQLHRHSELLGPLRAPGGCPRAGWAHWWGQAEFSGQEWFPSPLGCWGTQSSHSGEEPALVGTPGSGPSELQGVMGSAPHSQQRLHSHQPCLVRSTPVYHDPPTSPQRPLLALWCFCCPGGLCWNVSTSDHWRAVRSPHACKPS